MQNKRQYTAPAGQVFTNGTVFGSELWLGEQDSLENWELITTAEAEKRKAEREVLPL